MNRPFVFGFFVVSMALLSGTAFGAPDPQAVDLKQLDGWDIVIGEDAIPSEVFAAEEFRSILHQAGGRELPIVKQARGDGKHVFIGQSDSLPRESLGFDLASMGPEEFRIVVRTPVIAIAGGRPRGTLYGVYSFLEDHLGVRFLTADHTYIPPLPDSKLVGPLEQSFRPALSFRWSYYGETNHSPSFAVRLRVNTVGGDPKYGGESGQSLISHSFGHQIPMAKYGADHPEYFALRKGKRLANLKDDWFDTEPCLTHPDVLKIVTDSVLQEIAAHPEKENVSVSQNDNDKHCLCPKCLAIDEREGTPMGSLLEFVNAIADVVATKHPQVQVGTLSYWYTRTPPKSLKPRANVQIQLCSIECCLIHPIDDPNCELNVRFCRDMDEWSKLTDNIYIWNYNTNFTNYLLPCPNLRVIGPNVRYFTQRGVRGIFMQAAGNSTGAELSDLRNYVMARLLWDPTRDAAALVDEFLDLHYAEAAPPIRHFIRFYHDHCESKKIHRNCFGRAADYAIDETVAQTALDSFAEAMKLSQSDAVRNRVEKASICAYRAAIEPVWEAGSSGKALTAEQVDTLRPLARTLVSLCDKYQVPQFAETVSMDEAKKRLRDNLGLKDNEPF